MSTSCTEIVYGTRARAWGSSRRPRPVQAEPWVTLASETLVFTVWSGAWTGTPAGPRTLPRPLLGQTVSQ